MVYVRLELKNERILCNKSAFNLIQYMIVKKSAEVSLELSCYAGQGR